MQPGNFKNMFRSRDFLIHVFSRAILDCFQSYLLAVGSEVIWGRGKRGGGHVSPQFLPASFPSDLGISGAGNPGDSGGRGGGRERRGGGRGGRERERGAMCKVGNGGGRTGRAGGQRLCSFMLGFVFSLQFTLGGKKRS